MSWGMAAVAGASLVGSAMAADSAGDAAETQAQGAREANALTQQQFVQMRDDLSPYRQYGSNSANMLAAMLGVIPQSQVGPFNAQEYLAANPDVAADPYFSVRPEEHYNRHGMGEGRRLRIEQPGAAPAGGAAFGSLLQNFTGEDLANDPGYKFGLDQGMQALDRRMASGGNYFSGAALKGAQRFGQDYAGTKFTEAFNRDAANKTRQYNFLAGLTSTGQNAAAQTGNAGQAMAQQVGANTTSAANAAGAAQIAQGNAWAGGLNNLAGMYQQNQLLNAITKGNTGFGGSEAWRTTGNGMPY